MPRKPRGTGDRDPPRSGRGGVRRRKGTGSASAGVVPRQAHVRRRRRRDTRVPIDRGFGIAFSVLSHGFEEEAGPANPRREVQSGTPHSPYSVRNFRRRARAPCPPATARPERPKRRCRDRVGARRPSPSKPHRNCAGGTATRAAPPAGRVGLWAGSFLRLQQHERERRVTIADRSVQGLNVDAEGRGAGHLVKLNRLHGDDQLLRRPAGRQEHRVGRDIHR